MTGFNMPPGCNESDILGNGPEDEEWETLLNEISQSGLTSAEARDWWERKDDTADTSQALLIDSLREEILRNNRYAVGLMNHILEIGLVEEVWLETWHPELFELLKSAASAILQARALLDGMVLSGRVDQHECRNTFQKLGAWIMDQARTTPAKEAKP